jgi:hypothetical protein
MNNEPAFAEVTGPDPDSGWQVDDDIKAAWAFRKLAEIETKVKTVEAVAQAEIDRIAEWKKAQVAKHDRDLTFFRGQLEQYARREREHHGRRSVVTPWGSVKSRTSSPRIEVVDESTYLDWARMNWPDTVVVTEKPSLRAMNDTFAFSKDGIVVDSDGQPIPGVAMIPESVSFKVATENLDTGVAGV